MHSRGQKSWVLKVGQMGDGNELRSYTEPYRNGGFGLLVVTDRNRAQALMPVL